MNHSDLKMTSSGIPTTESSQVFVISGLGVDKRVFDEIDFGTPHVEFIDWIAPLPNETISDYARRLSSRIRTPNSTLIGLSFGGIVAVEIAKVVALQKVILIASAKTMDEIPTVYRTMGSLGLHKLAPTQVFKGSTPLTNWLFGTESRSDKKLLKQIRKDTDTIFIRWAINCIVNWKNKKIPKNIVHIHGSDDRILPIRNINVDYVIPNAGHFMTVNKADEISQLLRQIMNTEIKAIPADDSL